MILIGYGKVQMLTIFYEFAKYYAIANEKQEAIPTINFKLVHVLVVIEHLSIFKTPSVQK